MTRYNPPSHEIYEFPTLIDDPTKKRIIVEVTENPAGLFSQILFCIDTEVVDVNTDSIAVDDETIFGNYMFLHPIAGLKRKLIYSELPNFANLLADEVKRIERNEYQKLWIRKKREKHIKPVMCKQCDQFFLPKRSTAVFCSSKCRLQCHRASKSPAAS